MMPRATQLASHALFVTLAAALLTQRTAPPQAPPPREALLAARQPGSGRPMMGITDSMRALACWGRPDVLQDEKCMDWLAQHCWDTTSGVEVCEQFWALVKETCEGPDGPDKETACKYHDMLDLDMGSKESEPEKEPKKEEPKEEMEEPKKEEEPKEEMEEPREEEEEPKKVDERDAEELKKEELKEEEPEEEEPQKEEPMAEASSGGAPAPAPIASPAASPNPAPGSAPGPAPGPMPAASPFGAPPGLDCKGKEDCLPPCEEHHLSQESPPCRGVPLHKEFKMRHLSKSVPEAGLPEGGFDEFSNRLVSHEDQETLTGDWEQEWPQADESEGKTKEQICEENPNNGWCKLFLAHRERKQALEQPPTEAPWWPFS